MSEGEGTSPGGGARGPLSFSELRDVLELSLRAGRLMLENGANTARVEQTVDRLGRALGADRIDVYVTPTGIIASDHSGEEHRTKVARIHSTGIDLGRVAAVMAATDRAERGELDLAGVRAELTLIGVQPRTYGVSLTVAAVALACAAFATIVGGGWKEATATAIAAAMAHVARSGMGRHALGRVVATYVVAVIGSWAGLMLARIMGAPNAEVALLSPVLLLVPGVLMVSSVADLFRGDTISGLGRATQSFLVTATIGAGLWTTTLLSTTRVTTASSFTLPLFLSAPLALIAAAGFAILFDVPRRALLPAAVIGMAAFVARNAGVSFGAPVEVAMFLGGFTSALLAEPAARWMRLPTTMFIIPGFIPLVPGVAAFRTLLELANENYDAGTAGLVRTAVQIGALAAGVGAVNSLRPAPRSA